MRTTLLISILIISLSFSEAPAGPATDEPAGLAAYTLEMPEFNWLMSTSAHFRLHYLPGSAAEWDIDALAEQNEEILNSHLLLLGIAHYDRIIDLFYFDTREQIEKVVTKPFRALADASSLTVLAVRNDEETARDAHEIMHIASYDLWGGWERRAELAWLGEGLATYADVPCNGYAQSELAAYILMNTPDAVPLDSLATQFRTYPEMIGYMLMASFVEFILDTYGLERLRELWVEGYDSLDKVFGKSAREIEQEWHRHLEAKYPKPAVSNWPSLKEHGCR